MKRQTKQHRRGKWGELRVEHSVKKESWRRRRDELVPRGNFTNQKRNKKCLHWDHHPIDCPSDWLIFSYRFLWSHYLAVRLMVGSFYVTDRSGYKADFAIFSTWLIFLSFFFSIYGCMTRWRRHHYTRTSLD